MSYRYLTKQSQTAAHLPTRLFCSEPPACRRELAQLASAAAAYQSQLLENLPIADLVDAPSTKPPDRESPNAAQTDVPKLTYQG
jgi:hypothetical protein